MSGEAKQELEKKAENFSEWYNSVIEIAALSDKRYPVKGMNVWTGYGWKIMRKIDNLSREYMEETDHDEVHFPLLVSKDQFQKEADHIKGFDAEVFWVTHAGRNELDVPLLLRPTSETAMYPMFALWVRAHTDLPLKTYQIVNTFRYETKMTRSFIRMREIHFFEAHTCHVDFEDAEQQIREDLEIMEKLAEDLAIPFLLTKRPRWDTFPGAFYTIGVDCVMPTGRSLQLASIHQYKTNFSEPYGIKYEDKDGEFHFAHQTTYGMSERLLGAVIGIHGDDLGLILPPRIAPFQAVIVPIPAKGKVEKVHEEAEKLKKELKNFRVFLDLEDSRPGAKYYKWEKKGVPVRIEIGLRDIKKGQLVLVRRDTKEKLFIPREELLPRLEALLEEIQSNLLEKAQKDMEKKIITVTDDHMKGDEANAVLRVSFCGSQDCAETLEKDLGIKVLGEVVDARGEFILPDESLNSTFTGKPSCLVCGKPVPNRVHYGAKTY